MTGSFWPDLALGIAAALLLAWLALVLALLVARPRGLDLHISMMTVPVRSAKWNPAARRQCAGDPAERRLPQHRRPHHHRRTRRPGRALAGVKVDDVDTYHPFPCKTPNRTIRPVPGGLIKRRVSRLKELIRRYRRVLEPRQGRDDQTELVDRVRALDWSRADGATAQVRRRDGAQVGWGRRRLDRPAGRRPRLAAGPTAPPSAAGTPGPPGRRGRRVRRGPTAPRRR
jgi:hypothetical protein